MNFMGIRSIVVKKHNHLGSTKNDNKKDIQTF